MDDRPFSVSGFAMEAPAEMMNRAPSADSTQSALVDSDTDSQLTLEFLREGGLLDLPLGQAAKALVVSSSSLKRTSKGLGLVRWPYRQRSSLRQLMANAVEYMDDSMDTASRRAVLEALQRELDDVRGISGNGITEATRRFRQAIFKLNHETKRKQQRRKFKAASRQGIPNQVEYCIEPSFPTSAIESNNPSKAGSPELDQPVLTEWDSIDGYTEAVLEDATFQIDDWSSEAAACFQTPPSAPSTLTYRGPFLPKLQPGVVYLGRPLSDQTLYQMAPVPQESFQIKPAAVKHDELLGIYSNHLPYLPGSANPTEEIHPNHPYQPPPELRWLVYPGEDPDHCMKPHGAYSNFGAPMPCHQHMGTTIDGYFLGNRYPPAAMDSPPYGDGAWEMTDMDLMSALDLL